MLFYTEHFIVIMKSAQLSMMTNNYSKSFSMNNKKKAVILKFYSLKFLHEFFWEDFISEGHTTKELF